MMNKLLECRLRELSEFEILNFDQMSRHEQNVKNSSSIVFSSLASLFGVLRSTFQAEIFKPPDFLLLLLLLLLLVLLLLISLFSVFSYF